MNISQAAISISLIFPEHPLRKSPVCSQRMYYLLIFASIPTWCCGNITRQRRENIRSWYCRNISCANFVNVPNEHTRNVLRVFATYIRELGASTIKWDVRCSMLLLLCSISFTITRFITVNLIFTIYLSIMATCQEFVELGQTAIKIMLIAFWSLSYLTHSLAIYQRKIFMWSFPFTI